MYNLYRMLQYDRGLDVAHNAQGGMARERAMERFSQHPQLNGNGRQRRKANMESEYMEGEGLSGGRMAPMSRLVGHGRKKAVKMDMEGEGGYSGGGELVIRHGGGGYSGGMDGCGGASGGGHPAYKQGKMFADFYKGKHGEGQSKQMLHGMLKGSGLLDMLGGLAKGAMGLFGLGKGKNMVSEQGDMFMKFINKKHGEPHMKQFMGGVLSGGGWLSLIPALASAFMGSGGLSGGGFWEDFGRGFQKGFTGTLNVGAPLLGLLPGGQAPAAVLQGISKLAGGRNHAFKQRVSQVMERADMGNPHSKSAKRAMAGMGQPNGVPEYLGSPSNGGDPSGAVDVGRTANPGLGFQRNTVGAGMSGGYGGINHNNPDGGLNFGSGGVSGGKKRRAKAGVSDARKKRGDEVSRLMREKGMSLGEASKHIKEHGY